VVVQGTADVDCVPPVISNVQSSEVSGLGATITWETDEPADSLVTYGDALPDLTASVSGLATAHTVELTGLAECTLYSFSVTSVDEAGNSATHDNAGAYYNFETGKNVNPTYPTLDPPISIPDNNPTGAEQVIVITDDEPIVDLDVQVFITHTFTGDLELSLIGPDGTEVMLSENHGGSGNNFSGTIFDDEADTAITSGSPPFSGSFRPDELLSVFDDTTATGEWKLHVVDQAGIDTGSIDSWSLLLTYPARTCGPHLEYETYVMSDSCAGFGSGGQNGRIEPAEDALLNLTIHNDGTDLTTDITARLSTTTPGVTITNALAQYPDLEAGESAGNPLSQFAFTVDAAVACGTTIQFSVEALANEGDWTSGLPIIVGGTVIGGTCNGCFVQLPADVPNVGWSDTTTLQWPPATGAKFYNLYRGVRADLPALLTETVDSCKRLTTADLASGSVLYEEPSADSIHWYLVSAGNGGGEGPAGDASDGPRFVNEYGVCP